jgi:drug/metabolite transporter (DMT)-like permease
VNVGGDGRALTILVVIVQVLTLAGGQVLWKRGIDQAGGFLTAGQPSLGALLALFMNPTFLAGSALYLISTLIWFALLARFELSFIYPFLGLTYLVSFLGAWFVLGEAISIQRWIAVVLIVAGIALVSQT